MTLTNSKINTVRNINLIYVFSTNSIFNKESNKYVGIKLVYNNSSIIEADYKDPLFGELIKRVLDRYNKEKGSRNIVLLGEFTKKLINEASFYALDGISKKEEQIKYYSYENKLLNKYKPYLFETIRLIFKEILKCELVDITNLTGYNKVFKLDYNINGINKNVKIVIYNKNDEMCFKIGNIENTDDYILGSIKQDSNKLIVEYKYGKYIGTSIYDPSNMDNIRKIYTRDDLYYINDSLETILEEDKGKVSSYLNLMGIEPLNILKINDDTFLAFYSDNVIKDGQVLYKQDLIFINLEEDIVRVINSQKEGFSKFDGIVNVSLDNKEDSITIRKLFEVNKNILIKESCKDDDYSYGLMLLDEDINLKETFDLSKFDDSVVTSIDDVKQYKKEVK